MTLADEGWVRISPGGERGWELTGHIHLVAHMAQGSSSLRQRALPALAALRDASGETAALTVPDIGRFVVVEVVESRQLLRTAPHVGMVVVTGDSATGRAVLPYLPPGRQAELLGWSPPDAALRASFEATFAQGYAISEDDHGGGSINIAAPVFEVDGWPVAAVLLSAPRERLKPADYARTGAMVLQTARELSLARPRMPAPQPVAG
jgi:DNA-binding IclR family transcriptional regulator